MKKKLLVCLLLLVLPGSVNAQLEIEAPDIFGYFQTTVSYERSWDIDDVDEDTGYRTSSFYLQHMNVMMQKKLDADWTMFANFEFFNNYSSYDQWGGFSIEEAWVKKRFNKKVSLKFGLQTPIFNNLNEIKTKSPVLPYIIRPIVYESSFQEFIKIDEYVPQFAFAQAYGFLPYDRFKMDYAFYIGNSPQMSQPDESDNRREGVTGMDESFTLLFGGRLGLRFKDVKVGVSVTRDFVDYFRGLEAIYGGDPEYFEDRLRMRLGFDLSFRYKKFSFEGELIDVSYDEGVADKELDLDRAFYYATIGYHFTERFFLYNSWWYTDEDIVRIVDPSGTLERYDQGLFIRGFGWALALSDRMTLKFQYADVTVENGYCPTGQDGFYITDEQGNILRRDIDIEHTSLAISVFF